MFSSVTLLPMALTMPKEAEFSRRRSIWSAKPVRIRRWLSHTDSTSGKPLFQATNVGHRARSAATDRLNRATASKD